MTSELAAAAAEIEAKEKAQGSHLKPCPDAVEALLSALACSEMVEGFKKGAPADVLRLLERDGFTIARQPAMTENEMLAEMTPAKPMSDEELYSEMQEAMRLRDMGKMVASIVYAQTIAKRYAQSQQGWRPIAQPVADEKLREAVLQFKSSLNNMNVKADWFESWKTIEAAIAELAELRAERQWNTTVMPEFEKTVMVERESGGFWWGQFVLGEWHLKYGDGCIVADDVIAWRDLPSSSKATPPATGGV